MDALRIVLNEANTDIIKRSELLQKKVELLDTVEEKIDRFIDDLFWAEYAPKNREYYDSELESLHNGYKDLDSKEKDALFEKSQQIKRMTPHFFHRLFFGREYEAYLTGVRHMIHIIDAILYSDEVKEPIELINKIYNLETREIELNYEDMDNEHSANDIS